MRVVAREFEHDCCTLQGVYEESHRCVVIQRRRRDAVEQFRSLARNFLTSEIRTRIMSVSVQIPGWNPSTALVRHWMCVHMYVHFAQAFEAVHHLGLQSQNIVEFIKHVTGGTVTWTRLCCQMAALCENLSVQLDIEQLRLRCLSQLAESEHEAYASQCALSLKAALIRDHLDWTLFRQVGWL